ncbi:MAG: bacillithiol biosynthesis deacetylase BshB1 [Anaerolineae bacterium]
MSERQSEPCLAVDVMAFGAHPDDIEIGCGGTLIKMCEAGHSVVLVDMVRGEMGTRGTVEMRQAEAAAAARIIGALARENLELEDGYIHVNEESRRKVAEVVRKYRPRLAFLPYFEGRHPDHYHASEVAYEGIFLAGLVRYETGQEAHRPAKIIYYPTTYQFDPTFVVDITAQIERKLEAIYAYNSQFNANDPTYPQTRLTSPAFKQRLIHRMGYYGSLIGKEYGEGFLIRGKLEVEDPLALSFTSF